MFAGIVVVVMGIAAFLLLGERGQKRRERVKDLAEHTKETAEEKFAAIKQKLMQSKDRLEGGRSLELRIGGHRLHVGYDTDET